MKLLKKLTVIILIASVLTSVFCFSASTVVIYDGGFGFEVNASKHEARLVKYNGAGENIQLPEYFRDYPVTVIDRNAFSGNKTIKEIVLSGSLLAIPDYSFTACPNLKYVTIPKSVMLIQPHAFDWDNMTIGCYYDSYACSFARENGYNYELIDGVMLGDGIISIGDVTAVQQHLAELTALEGIYLYALDINGDGKVEITDEAILQRYLAQYEEPYQIGQVLKK